MMPRVKKEGLTRFDGSQRVSLTIWGCWLRQMAIVSPSSRTAWLMSSVSEPVATSSIWVVPLEMRNMRAPLALATRQTVLTISFKTCWGSREETSALLAAKEARSRSLANFVCSKSRKRSMRTAVCSATATAKLICCSEKVTVASVPTCPRSSKPTTSPARSRRGTTNSDCKGLSRFSISAQVSKSGRLSGVERLSSICRL